MTPTHHSLPPMAFFDPGAYESATGGGTAEPPEDDIRRAMEEIDRDAFDRGFRQGRWNTTREHMVAAFTTGLVAGVVAGALLAVAASLVGLL